MHQDCSLGMGRLIVPSLRIGVYRAYLLVLRRESPRSRQLDLRVSSTDEAQKVLTLAGPVKQ